MLNKPSKQNSQKSQWGFSTDTVRQVDVKELENGYCDIKTCLFKMRPNFIIFLALSTEMSCDIYRDNKDSTVA